MTPTRRPSWSRSSRVHFIRRRILSEISINTRTRDEPRLSLSRPAVAESTVFQEGKLFALRRENREHRLAADRFASRAAVYFRRSARRLFSGRIFGLSGRNTPTMCYRSRQSLREVSLGISLSFQSGDRQLEMLELDELEFWNPEI